MMLPFSKKTKNFDEFENLIETHLDGMYRVAMRYSREPAAAEDLVQDTVVRALRFRDHFELGTNFKAWIYTVLTHTFIHKYRRQKREREVLDGTNRADVDRQLRSEATREALDKPEKFYLQHLLSDDVVHALDSLPEEFRTVIVLCDLEGLSYKEIADVVDIPVGTVMSRLYRGRRVLEKKLLGVAVERGIVKSGEREESSDRGVVELRAYKRRKDG
jgi:RNA polymerase sigma-70 factor (ECF subfamily)